MSTQPADSLQDFLDSLESATEAEVVVAGLQQQLDMHNQASRDYIAALEELTEAAKVIDSVDSAIATENIAEKVELTQLRSKLQQ